MSYPIKKITYCTAIPKNATFAMVTRSIQQQADDLTYCHMFAVSNAEQVYVHTFSKPQYILVYVQYLSVYLVF